MDGDPSQEDRIRLIGRLFFIYGDKGNFPCVDALYLFQLSA